VKAPLVSVVIPARNRPAYLAQTLRSLRKQTFRDYELVLVDDASRPPLRGVLARSGVRPWTYVRHFSALGPAASRNDGLRAARGELIALLDSDDLWYPGKLAAQAACFRSPHVLFVHSNVDFIDGRGGTSRSR
jgi:teichuronic acid biosynthesis glycosyltransferase TuaG